MCIPTNKIDEFLDLLELYIRIVEANKNTTASGDQRILGAEGLAIKLFGHASTVYYIYHDTVLPISGIRFTDPASINVLARAAFETFLVFHYLFLAPESEEEEDFRYNSWLLAGYIERQAFPIKSPAGKKKLLEEKKLIMPLQAKLRDNEYFKRLPKRQQRTLLEKGRWRLHSWKDIALDSGLALSHAQTFYSYLCGYAHAGNLSATQIHQARTPQSRETLCAATIGFVMISAANMILAYCRVFPKSELSLRQDKHGTELVDKWTYVGATPL